MRTGLLLIVLFDILSLSACTVGDQAEMERQKLCHFLDTCNLGNE